VKALLLTEYKKMSYVDVADPVCGPDDVLIQVRACGICGSDIHGYDGSTGRRIPPLVMGHEAAGVITGVGAAVKGFVPGDRVTFDSTVFCGECVHCQRGDVNLCDNRQVLGVSCGDYRRHGAFAEFVTVPARILHKLPAELGFAEAAMIEAVSVGVHAVRLTPVAPGDTAVVVGTGMIGLLTLQAAKIAGFAQVIAVDTEDSRLAVAKELGATHSFNPKTGGDLTDYVKSLTKGQGADAAFECVGLNATVLSAINAVRKGGTVTLVGNLSPKTELPLQIVVTRQLRLQGSCASAGEIPRCIELLATKQIKVDKIISAVAPLEQGADWFAKLYAGAPGVMKVILAPQV
jgi:L-iditol 2-dehydrogenase